MDTRGKHVLTASPLHWSKKLAQDLWNNFTDINCFNTYICTLPVPVTQMSLWSELVNANTHCHVSKLTLGDRSLILSVGSCLQTNPRWQIIDPFYWFLSHPYIQITSLTCLMEIFHCKQIENNNSDWEHVLFVLRWMTQTSRTRPTSRQRLPSRCGGYCQHQPAPARTYVL